MKAWASIGYGVLLTLVFSVNSWANHGHIYPVSGSFSVSQGFRTSVLWNDGKFDGGWCSDTNWNLVSWLHNLQDCQAGGNYWWRYNHTGLDVVATGVVNVIADGTLEVKKADYPGYGNVKVFRHSDGMCSLYGHMRNDALWGNGVVGYQAKKGDPIGTVGDTGVSGHQHLHFAVYECGMPMPYLVGSNPIQRADLPHGYLYADDETFTSLLTGYKSPANSLLHFE